MSVRVTVRIATQLLCVRCTTTIKTDRALASQWCVPAQSKQCSSAGLSSLANPMAKTPLKQLWMTVELFNTLALAETPLGRPKILFAGKTLANADDLTACL